MTDLVTQITPLTTEQAFDPAGNGHHGLYLNGGDFIAFACPLIGYGGNDGLSGALNTYGKLMENLWNEAQEVGDGEPVWINEILLRTGENVLLIRITYQH